MFQSSFLFMGWSPEPGSTEICGAYLCSPLAKTENETLLASQTKRQQNWTNRTETSKPPKRTPNWAVSSCDTEKCSGECPHLLRGRYAVGSLGHQLSRVLKGPASLTRLGKPALRDLASVEQTGGRGAVGGLGLLCESMALFLVREHARAPPPGKIP